MNISTGDGLKIQFGGELKRSPRRTISALPKVSYSLGYQVQDEKGFDFSASVTPQPRPDLQGGSLAWEFEIPQSIREVIVSDGNQEQKISVSRDKSKVLWKEDASRLKECGSIIFLDNAQQEILKMGSLQFDKLRSLSLETTAKGVPVFRFIFFESEKCDKPETRAFRCRWDVK